MQDETKRLTLAEFKAVAREQFLMLIVDQQAAVAAIPQLIPKDTEARRKAISMIRQVLSASGEITGEIASRLKEIAGLLGVDAGTPSDATVVSLPQVSKIEGTKAS